MSDEVKAAEVHEAFLRAYAEVPCQDNAGWVPERGSFKVGFKLGAAWGHAYGYERGRGESMSQKLGNICDNCDSLRAEVERMRMEHAVWEKHSLTQVVLERDSLKAEVERLKSTGRDHDKDDLILERDALRAALRLATQDICHTCYTSEYLGESHGGPMYERAPTGADCLLCDIREALAASQGEKHEGDA